MIVVLFETVILSTIQQHNTLKWFEEYTADAMGASLLIETVGRTQAWGKIARSHYCPVVGHQMMMAGITVKNRWTVAPGTSEVKTFPQMSLACSTDRDVAPQELVAANAPWILATSGALGHCCGKLELNVLRSGDCIRAAFCCIRWFSGRRIAVCVLAVCLSSFCAQCWEQVHSALQCATCRAKRDT